VRCGPGRRLGMAALVGAALLTAGCGIDGDSVAGAPAPAPAGPAGVPPRAACANLVAGGRSLVSTAIRFTGTTATADQVRQSASALSRAAEAKRATLGSAAKAHLDDAQASLHKLVIALDAQPTDLAAEQSAANDTLASLREVATICRAGASLPPSGG
jgi:hypothetical protein